MHRVSILPVFRTNWLSKMRAGWLCALQMELEHNIPSTCQRGRLGWFIIPSSPSVSFFSRASGCALEAIHTGRAGTPALPAPRPPAPRHVPRAASPPAHRPQPALTCAAQPAARPQRLWSDSAARQEAPHFPVIALFTGCITLPQRSLSAA